MLNPRIDFIFKKLFGSEENKPLLISLINSIVSQEDQVQDLVLKNPYNAQNFLGDKESILDIKAQDTCGKWYNIEMQISNSGKYEQRALYYWARVYSSQLVRGNSYGLLTKTITISLLDYSLFNSSDYHHIYRIFNVKDYSAYLPHLELHFVELRKAPFILNTHMSLLERWAHFLASAESYEQERAPKEILEIGAISHALDTLKHISLNADEREAYEGRHKWILDQVSSQQYHQEKGKEEEREKIAKNMLLQGLSIDIIASATNLSPEQMEKIQKEMKGI